MTLFERVKETAKKRGWSLQETAQKAGLGINSIYAWKNKTPSVDRIKSVADVLGVTVDYLLGTGNTPDWATQKDVTDLKQYLEDDAAQNSLNFGGDALTEEENEKLRIAITQIFWEKLKDHKRQQGK
ncbi:MAG: helix-turn-helix domain-containing protein [Lactobacillus sp.]